MLKEERENALSELGLRVLSQTHTTSITDSGLAGTVRLRKAVLNRQPGDTPIVHLKIDCVELTTFSLIKPVL
jgi:hypothetical protein